MPGAKDLVVCDDGQAFLGPDKSRGEFPQADARPLLFIALFWKSVEAPKLNFIRQEKILHALGLFLGPAQKIWGQAVFQGLVHPVDQGPQKVLGLPSLLELLNDEIIPFNGQVTGHSTRLGHRDHPEDKVGLLANPVIHIRPGQV